MSALSIYVAGGSADRATIATLIAELRGAGWTVTHDWTRDPGWTDPSHPREISANEDLHGVFAARVFWLVLPEAKSEGAHFELGVAVALGFDDPSRDVVVSGPAETLGRIFPTLADVSFDRHADALEYLLARAREHG